MSDSLVEGIARQLQALSEQFTVAIHFKPLAEAILAAQHERHFVDDLTRTTRIPSDSVVRLLFLMRTEGWLSAGSYCERPGDQRRRCYMLTDLGRRELSAKLHAGGPNP